jgi:hypothetical protein
LKLPSTSRIRDNVALLEVKIEQWLLTNRDTDEACEAELRLNRSLWCPYCQAGHAILGKDIQVVADVVPLRHRDVVPRRSLRADYQSGAGKS